MKRIISIGLAFFMLMSTAVFCNFAFAASPITFDAERIGGTSYRITKEVATEDGMKAVKVNPTTDDAVPKLDLHNLKADPKEYKYLKFIFKTNNNEHPIVFDFQKGTAGDFLGARYSFVPKTTNEWVGAIIELDASLINSGKIYNQVHLWTFGDESAVSLNAKGAEMFIQSYGFFSTLDEAKEYNKDKYTVLQLPGENGTPGTGSSAGATQTPVNKEPAKAEKAEPVIFSGVQVKANVHRITFEEATENGAKVLSVKPTTESTVPKLDKYGFTAPGKNYSYVKIIFKSNNNTDNMLLEFIGNSTSNKLGGKYSVPVKEKDTWIGAIIELDPGNIESGMNYAQYHLSVWGSLSGLYLSEQNATAQFESVGFFSTLDEAKEYNKSFYEIEEFVEFGSSHSSSNTQAPKIENIQLTPNRDAGVYGLASTELDGSPVVITPNMMLAGFSDPEKNITFPKELTDDGFARFTFARNTTVGKMQFSISSNFASDIDKNVYKYFKVCYRYNLTTPDANYKMMLREGHSGQSTNHTLFELPKGKNGEWIEQYTEIKWQTSKEPGTYTLHPVREGESVTAGDYFDFAYIGFFSSEEDAKNYTFSESEASESIISHAAYMTGYADGTFLPQKTMTRAEACTVIARILDTEENIAKCTASSFTDVKPEMWYTKYISYCESKGILSEFAGEFLPDSNITRADFALLAYNTGLAKENPANAKTFTDVSETHPRYAAIMAAATAGLVGGYEDGTFLPDKTITRAEVVTVINRALGRVHNEFTMPSGYKVTEFTDVSKDFWAYSAICEATTPHIVYNDPIAGNFNCEIWASEAVVGDAAKAKLSEVDALWNSRKEEILNTKDEITVTGTSYYVSVSGDDKNPGTDPSSPRKTVPAKLSAGDGVFFKRGDTFRMYLYCVNGVTYGAYGEGAKPRILGSPANYAEYTWTKIDGYNNVYACDTAVSADVGLVVFNDGELWADKYWTEKASDITLDKLTADNMFIHDKKDGKVYVRSDKGNPAEIYHTIDFNVKQNIVSGGSKDLRLDNLCFMYTGAHGIGGTRNNTVITNCVFGFIGGSEQNSTARYGNAIEFWGPSINCKVYNCYIYQVYDAGLTFQMKGDGTKGVAEGFDGIVFDNNLVEKCAYNIEYFTRDYKDNLDVIANCTISNNILRDAGVGICRSAPGAGTREAAIKGWDTKNQATNFVIENNIFDRSPKYLLDIGSLKWDVEKQVLTVRTPEFLPIMRNNVYIQNKGALIAHWNGNNVNSDDNVHYSLAVKSSCENTADIYILD